MFLKADELEHDEVVTCDICIVGTGHGGMSTALELADSGRSVLLLESGTLRRDAETQKLYDGESLSHLHASPLLYRERFFGGTSHVWGGRCSPYDAQDMTERPYMPNSAWPIKRSDLDSAYERAYELCDIGRYSVEVDDLLGSNAPDMIPGLDSQKVRTDRAWLFSLPTNFGTKFRSTIKSSTTINCLLGANVLSIELSADGQQVEYLDAATLDDRRFKVRAQRYVIAAGGVETTRLLLSSRSVLPNGIGNHSDLLGRNYISHICGKVGPWRFKPKGGPLIWSYDRTVDDIYMRRAIRIDEQALDEAKLPNIRLVLDIPPPSDPAHGNAVLSAMYLLKRFIVRHVPPEYAADLNGLGPVKHLGAHVKNCVLGLPHLFRFGFKWLFKRILARRKLPSLLEEDAQNRYWVHFDAEQRPNPNSQLRLSERNDRFGNPLITIDYQVTDEDIDSTARAIEMIASELVRCGVAEINMDPAEMRAQILKYTGVGSHNYGTTRMAAQPDQGVVDANCRVFGVDNLYIASSSVLPTASFANPGLTICAIGVRLGRHLKSQALDPAFDA